MTQQITLILTGPSHVRIFWGDGQKEDLVVLEGVEQPISHTYLTDGEYDVRVRGVTKAIQIDSNPIVHAVTDFGDMECEHYRFSNNSNLTTVPDTLPDTVLNIDWMFSECGMFAGNELMEWDVSKVITGNGAFYNSGLTADLGMWKTGSFREMMHMFSAANTDRDASTYNHNLTCWDVAAIIALPIGFSDGNYVWDEDYLPLWGQAATDSEWRTGASCYAPPPPSPRYEVTADYNYGSDASIQLQLNDQRIMESTGLLTDSNTYRHAMTEMLTTSGIRDYENSTGDWSAAQLSGNLAWDYRVWFNGDLVAEAVGVVGDTPILYSTQTNGPGNYSIEYIATVWNDTDSVWDILEAGEFSYGEWPVGPVEPEDEVMYLVTPTAPTETFMFKLSIPIDANMEA